MNTSTLDHYIDFWKTTGAILLRRGFAIAGIVTTTVLLAIAMSCIGWYRFGCHCHRKLPYWMAEAKETYLDWEYKVKYYAPIVLGAIDKGFQIALSLR